MRSPTTTRRSRNGRKTRCSIFPFASCSVLVPFSRFSSSVRSHKVDLKQNKQTKKLGAATVFGHLKYCARVLVGIGASILGHFPFVPHYTHIPPFTSWILSLSLFFGQKSLFFCAPPISRGLVFHRLIGERSNRHTRCLSRYLVYVFGFTLCDSTAV